MKCDKCGSIFCYDHSNAHLGKSCKEYNKQSRESNQMNQSFIKESSIRCPNPFCRIATHKYSGCNHITCSRCKTEYCYLCGGLYLNGLHYSNWILCFGCRNMNGDRGMPGSRNTLCRTILIWIYYINVLPLIFIFLGLIKFFFLSFDFFHSNPLDYIDPHLFTFSIFSIFIYKISYSSP